MPRFQVNAVIVAVIFIAWAIATGLLPPAEGGRIVEDFSSIPTDIAGWYGTNGTFEKTIYEQLPTCSLLSRDYIDSEGNGVNLSIVYGRELGDFHQPERCMQGSGWKPETSRVVWLHPKGSKPHQATVITMKSDYHDLVMVYWFYMGEKLSPTMGGSKMRAVMNAMLGRKVAPSAMIKFSANADWSRESAEKNAVGLAEQLGPHIVKMVKKTPKYESSDRILKEMSD